MKKVIDIVQLHAAVYDSISSRIVFVEDEVDVVVSDHGNWIGEIKQAAYNHRYRELAEHKKVELEAAIKSLMHAQRDCFRNQGKDATKIPGLGPRDSYYCDCIGILRCLEIFGYGEFGACNATPAEPPELSAWLRRLEDEVMEEEGFHSDNRCEWCLAKYKKDDKSIREKNIRNAHAA